MKTQKRSEIEESSKWDLSSLFATSEEWKDALEALKQAGSQAASFKGSIKRGKASFLKLLKWLGETNILAERVGCWAMLNYSADASDPKNIRQYGMASQVLASLGAALAFFDPELLSLDEETYQAYLHDPDFQEYKVYLQKSRRFKAHVLSEGEERLMALQSESAQTSELTFSDLTNVDMDFGTVEGKPLTQSTYSTFMQSTNRATRKEAYDKLYGIYGAHQHTLARLYEGSVKQDIFSSKVRGYASSRDAALFPDKVDGSVYDTLVASVHAGFDSLHRFYEVKRRVLGLEKLAHWDVYVPLVMQKPFHTTYDAAVETVLKAVKPLGDEYVSILGAGLTTERWVDRYENTGKRSGAFSSGCYTSKPYILLNFTGDTLNDLFTIIHEGGHSMHSYYSKKHNPFFQYDYTIFEAEVASTTNEQLLARYLLDHAKDKDERASIIGKQLDDIVATLFRQTMFAEFEDQAHKLAESGETLSVDVIRAIYRKLLVAYFGNQVEFSELSDMEGLRIPHFYNAFYVYKYATGISAAIALSQKILEGGEKERNDYLAFLQSGGSRYPMESLKLAGVDMSKPDAVNAAVTHFATLLDEFEKLV